MEELPEFSHEYLSTLRYTHVESLVKYLKGMADRCGFKLSLKDSIKNRSIRMYCSKGNTSKGEHKTSKTDCPFKLIIIQKFDNGEYFVVSPASCLDHNHETIPKGYDLNNKTKSDIVKLSEMGLSAQLVQDVLFNIEGIQVSQKEIGEISTSISVMKDQDTDPLFSFMVDSNDFINYCYTSDQKRVAALTITKDEYNNLQQYGDVIFINSIPFENNLRWSIITIVVIDQFKHYRSGGLCFFSYDGDFVYEWLFNHIYSIVGEKWKTLFTYQEPGIMSGFASFVENKEISHYVCWFQKRNNFMKQLNSRKIENDMKNQLLSLFDSISFDHNEIQIHQSIDDMKRLCPMMNEYITNEIESRLPWFCSLWKGKSLTLGYRSLSPSESISNLIKLSIPNREHTLVEIRKLASRLFLKQDQKFNEISYDMYKDNHFLNEYYGIHLSNSIYTLIDKSIKKSRNVIIKQTGDNDYIAVSKSKCFDINTLHCTCMKTPQNGFPCSHMISLYRFLGMNFPVSHINERWIISKVDRQVPFPDRSDEFPKDGLEHGYRTQLNSSIESYQKIMSIAKEIAIRVVDTEYYSSIESEFQRILDQVSNENEKLDPEIKEISTKKEEIAYKKKQFKSQMLKHDVTKETPKDESFLE